MVRIIGTFLELSANVTVERLTPTFSERYTGRLIITIFWGAVEPNFYRHRRRLPHYHFQNIVYSLCRPMDEFSGFVAIAESKVTAES